MRRSAAYENPRRSSASKSSPSSARTFCESRGCRATARRVSFDVALHVRRRQGCAAPSIAVRLRIGRGAAAARGRNNRRSGRPALAASRHFAARPWSAIPAHRRAEIEARRASCSPPRSSASGPSRARARTNRPFCSGNSAGLRSFKLQRHKSRVRIHSRPGASTEIVAGPGAAFGPGRPARHSGEAAITSAGSPLILTLSASASPRSPAPQIQKRSRTETTAGSVVSFGSLAPAAGSISAAADAPGCLLRAGSPRTQAP